MSGIDNTIHVRKANSPDSIVHTATDDIKNVIDNMMTTVVDIT